VRRRSTAALAAGLAAALMLALAACGGGAAGGGTKPDVVVSAASSLKNAFTGYGDGFTAARARFSFGGSDQLAAQIEHGVKPDVFASANTKLPDALFAKGLVFKPVVFAANRLVIAVPAGSTKVRSIADLAKPGVTIAEGSPTVPVGSYTRKVLARLPAAERSRIIANVRSDEPDVAGVVGKVVQGAVDAGFVYVTDVTATAGKARAIALPASLQPRVAYGVAVVKGSPHEAVARRFIAGLVGPRGQAELRRAGFEPPPPT
jgi:molybdate transport system substrate-binding protein